MRGEIPVFSQATLQSMKDDSLLALLTLHEDRLPRAVIDECARRGEPLVPGLRALLENPVHWSDEASSGQWWSLLHAFMALGAIPGQASAEAMLVGFRHMATMFEDDNPLWDWLSGYWPALFRNKREHALPALRAIAEDPRQNWYYRIQALECVLEAAHARGGEDLENGLDWILKLIKEDPHKDKDFLGLAGNMMLDFPRERYRKDLETLGAWLETQASISPAFRPGDVGKAFDKGHDAPQWERFTDPWQFYDEEAIRKRQERWAREEAERLAEEEAARARWEESRPAVREAPKIGRNEPCPCGSGKKYKKCCLNKSDQPADLTWHRLRRVIDGLPWQMLNFAHETLGTTAVELAWSDFTYDPDEPFSPENPILTVFMPWFLYHWLAPGRKAVLASEFLHHKQGRRLDPLARRYVEAALQSHFSCYDVVASRPGQGMELRDIFTKETLEVTEHTASQTLRPGDILLAKPVSLDGLTVLESCGHIAIPPERKLPFVQLRMELEEKHGRLDSSIVRQNMADILDLYQDLVETLTNQGPPEIRNTDGERLKPQTLHFDIHDPQSAFDALWPLSLEEEPRALLDRAERDERGNLEKIDFPWLRPGNEQHKSWKNTILGHVRINGKRLTIHVNSDERARLAQQEVAQRLGEQARYRHSVHQSVEKMLQEAPQSLPEQNEVQALPPEVQEKLVQITEAHWDEWVHEKIPALGDMTPIEAAKTPEGRELLEALLTQFQRNAPLHGQLPPDYDPIPGLRARLGMEEEPTKP